MKLSSFLDFISMFSTVAWNYPTCQAFFYLWRVEVKVTCCSLEVFHERGLFCVFTLWLSCLAFLFLSPIALKLTTFLDFISILSSIAWNYPTWQVFFYFYFISGGLKLRQPVVAWKSSTSLAFSAFLPSLGLFLGFFVFIFYSAEVNQVPGFYQHFIYYSVELSHVPSFFFLFLEGWS